MDTQHFQEVYLQKYHTNSKRAIVLFSIFVSILINFAFFIVLCSFAQQSKISVNYKNVYAVNIIQPESNKKNMIFHNKILNKKKNRTKKCIKKIKKLDNKKSKKAISKSITIKNVLKSNKNHTNILLSKNKFQKNKKSNINEFSKSQISKPSYINISQSNYKNLYDWIASHKYYPISALYKNEEGSVVLSFKIDKNRNVSFVRIYRNAEYKSLNDAAVMIVKKSSPVPENIVNLSKIELPSVCLLKIVFRIQ